MYGGTARPTASNSVGARSTSSTSASLTSPCANPAGQATTNGTRTAPSKKRQPLKMSP